jgi:hypothetical protein
MPARSAEPDPVEDQGKGQDGGSDQPADHDRIGMAKGNELQRQPGDAAERHAARAAPGRLLATAAAAQ